tara:strand:+ start:675 stop:1385 length:711 start_codon:yes stop_codon:yes gene_type:complete
MNKILITGASSAIGNKLISEIDNKNLIIIAHYNKSNNFLNYLKSKKFKSKIIPIKSNFSKKKDLYIFLKKIRKYEINSIVHIASKRLNIKRFEDISLNDFYKEFTLSFNSIFEILKVFLPKMLEKRKGKIIFVLSNVTTKIPSGYLTSYVCLKFLLLGLIKSLNSEYKNNNINFNSISPSMMDTPFLKNLDKKFIEINKFHNPKKKLLAVSRVTKKIKYLLSNKSNNLNGQNIDLD